MKKLGVLLAALCMLQQAHALIVSVRGEGEVPEQGMELTITEGEDIRWSWRATCSPMRGR